MSDTTRPAVERLEAQPYVAVRGEVTPETFRSFIDSNFSKPIDWLGSNGLRPAGAPFIRYRALDADGNPALIEAGAPVEELVAPIGEDLVAGELPAGEYVTYLHVGPFQHDDLEDLGDASRKVVAWAEERGIDLDRTDSEDGAELGACAEFYLVDPGDEPDFTKWETRIVMLTAG